MYWIRNLYLFHLAGYDQNQLKKHFREYHNRLLHESKVKWTPKMGFWFGILFTVHLLLSFLLVFLPLNGTYTAIFFIVWWLAFGYMQQWYIPIIAHFIRPFQTFVAQRFHPRVRRKLEAFPETKVFLTQIEDPHNRQLLMHTLRERKGILVINDYEQGFQGALRVIEAELVRYHVIVVIIAAQTGRWLPVFSHTTSMIVVEGELETILTTISESSSDL